MTDELVKRLRENWITDKEALQVADRIEALTAELQVSNELGKALEEDAGQLREENAKLTADKRFILEERDRTFALMLARAEKAEAERDRAFRQRDVAVAFGTVCLEKLAVLELERDALREDVEELDFLRHEGGPDSVAAMEVELKRLREALEQFLIEYDEVDLADAEPSSLTAAVLAARAALKGESHE